MRVLVTGATGSMGAHIAKKYLDAGHEVVTIIHDDHTTDSAQLLGVYNRMSRAHGDITKEAVLSRVIADYEIDLVYHLAALPIVRVGTRTSWPIFEVNEMGTVRLLEALKEQTASGSNIGLVFCSTDKVYGEAEWGRAYLETDPLLALAPYETSKANADRACQMFQKMKYIHRLGIVRPSNIYGPSDLNSRIIPNTIRRCLKGQNPLLKRGIPYVREYTYVDDFVDAITRVGGQIMSSDRICSIYNIGSGFNADQPIVLSEILKNFPDSGLRIEEIEPEPYTRIEIPYQTLDSTKILRELGWKAGTSFSDGIRRTADWWKLHREIWEGKV